MARPPPRAHRSLPAPPTPPHVARRLANFAAPRPPGQAHREGQHFQRRENAEADQSTLNRPLITKGAPGVTCQAGLRVDAIAARERPNSAGHGASPLLPLADAFLAQPKRSDHGSDPINPVLLPFLADGESVEGGAPATIVNLNNRIWPWITHERIATLRDITREPMESIRANSRRNDIAAVSVFCIWLTALGAGRGAHRQAGLSEGRDEQIRRLPRGNEATAATVARLRERDLTTTAFFGLMLDGVRPGNGTVGVMARGLICTGEKRLLGLAVESCRGGQVPGVGGQPACNAGVLFRPPVASCSGARWRAGVGLGAAGRWPTACLQRCRGHEERNLCGYLRKGDHAEAARLWERLRRSAG